MLILRRNKEGSSCHYVLKTILDKFCAEMISMTNRTFGASLGHSSMSISPSVVFRMTYISNMRVPRVVSGCNVVALKSHQNMGRTFCQTLRDKGGVGWSKHSVLLPSLLWEAPSCKCLTSFTGLFIYSPRYIACRNALLFYVWLKHRHRLVKASLRRKPL